MMVKRQIRAYRRPPLPCVLAEEPLIARPGSNPGGTLVRFAAASKRFFSLSRTQYQRPRTARKIALDIVNN
jgi:hypothetical protein